MLDRFHIVAKMNKALDEIRAGESRRIASEGGVPVLKKSRWLLLKREENLKTEQRFRLRDLLRYNLKTVRAYPTRHLPATAPDFKLMLSAIQPSQHITVGPAFRIAKGSEIRVRQAMSTGQQS